MSDPQGNPYGTSGSTPIPSPGPGLNAADALAAPYRYAAHMAQSLPSLRDRHDVQQTSQAVLAVMEALAERVGFTVEAAQSRQRTELRLDSGARIGIEPLGETLLLHAVFPVTAHLPRHLLEALQRVAATSGEMLAGRNRDASNATDASRRARPNWTIHVAAQTQQDAHVREDALIVMVRLHGEALQLDEAEAALRYLHGWQPHAIDR
ncbi:hypothetical protein [Robbsia sp. KACC 23696]|uniref:hypothetical protein n=1 Tax=Robbsia sp. KACC 23696 TaxID=3149231 RepID=UPI00325A72DE